MIDSTDRRDKRKNRIQNPSLRLVKSRESQGPYSEYARRN